MAKQTWDLFHKLGPKAAHEDPCSLLVGTWRPEHRARCPGTDSLGGTVGCWEETNSSGALLLFHPCSSANYPSFAPDPILPTLRPAPAWNRPPSSSPASCSPPAFRLPASPGPQPPHPCCPQSPPMPVPRVGPVTQQRPCAGFCPRSPQPMGDGPPNTVWDPRRVKGRGQRAGGGPAQSLPSSSSASCPSPLLGQGRDGSQCIRACSPVPAPNKLWRDVCRGRGVGS